MSTRLEDERYDDRENFGDFDRYQRRPEFQRSRYESESSYRGSYDEPLRRTPFSEYSPDYGTRYYGREDYPRYRGRRDYGYRGEDYGRSYEYGDYRDYGYDPQSFRGAPYTGSFEDERVSRRYDPYGRRRHDRNWWDRASDEVASWFGDEDAERRRHLDEVRGGHYRGRGPRGYQRSDERIREDINDRLTDHIYLDAYEVDVSINEGEVVLSGKVNSRYDKRLVEDIAESVSGVRNVQNNLRIGQVSAAAVSSGTATTTSTGRASARSATTS